MSSKTRILVVDDRAIRREGLIRLVEAEHDLEVCAEAASGAQAVQALERQPFDLAIVDISLEGASGLELVGKIKLRWPEVIVVILSIHDGPLYSRRALEVGASGYVAEREAPEKMITAIREVLGGKTYVTNSGAAWQMSDTASIAEPLGECGLATRVRSIDKSGHGRDDRVKS